MNNIKNECPLKKGHFFIILGVQNHLFMKTKLLALLSFMFVALHVQAQTGFSYSNLTFCVYDPIEVPTITGQQGGIFTSSGGGLSLDAVTGAIYPIASLPGFYTVVYTVPANGNNPAESYTVAVGIESQVTPVFNQMTIICSGAPVPVLPTVSTNGIIGTWSPATVSNEVSTVYTFTPNPGQCASSTSVNIIVLPVETPVITAQDNHDYIYVQGTTVVQPLLLSTSLNGNYNYQWYESGVTISNANQASYLVNTHKEGGIHIYTVRATSFVGCERYSADFIVYESAVPAPIGNQDQTFTPGQTLADVVVQGQNIQWYDGLGRNVNANPLPLSTVLVDGVTYYASQTINGYESPDRLPVTVHLNAMANNTFEYNAILIVPNPVRNELNIQSREHISQVEIYNLTGQKLMSTTTTKLSMQALPSGIYIVQVSTKDKQQRLRVVKE